MKINELLKIYSEIEIDLLLAHLLGKSKEFLYLNPEKRLTRIQANGLTQMVKRRLGGEPIAYIIGYKDFYGLRFKVSKDVLIPRPETEMVVDLVSGAIPEFFRALSEKYPGPRNKLNSGPRLGGRGGTLMIKILDVGTGSGAIIISLAKTLSTKHLALSTQFYASDVSVKALKVARQNAKHHKAKIKFIHSDILENVRMSPDVIIANLPYLDFRWKHRSIKFEPRQALFAKEGGLFYYRRLLQQVAARQHQPHLIYLEIDPRQKAGITSLIKKHLPQGKTKFYRDYSNKWRYVEIITG